MSLEHLPGGPAPNRLDGSRYSSDLINVAASSGTVY